MLLVCSGSDTYQATQKADELERLFREKYDPRGLSVERLPDGKDAVRALSERAFSGGLFSSKLFFRGRGLLAFPKSQWQALHAAFVRSGEHVVIVTVEDEPMAPDVKKALADCKVVEYAFPYLQGSAFQRCARERAVAIGINDSDNRIRDIAERCDGDSWRLVNELQKYSVYGDGYELPEDTSSLTAYDVSDAWLRGGGSWRRLVDEKGGAGSSSGFLSAIRMQLRVRDGYTDGLHPFVVKKMSALKEKQTMTGYLSVLLSQFLVRSGFSTEEEIDVQIRNVEKS